MQCINLKKNRKKFAEINRNEPNTGLTHQKCFEKLLKQVKLPQKVLKYFIWVKLFQNVLQC